MKIFTLTFATIMLYVISGATVLSAQSLDEDATILYMKANVLFESERYDEAVRMYNRILNTDRDFVNAYHMRARAKYALGAYRGAKADLMEYVSRAGITKDIINTLLDTETKLDNLLAASNYAAVALEMDPYEASLYYKAGQLAINDNRKNDACEYFATGSSLGDSKCRSAFAKHCYGYVVKKNESTPSENDDMVTPINTDSSTKTAPKVEVERTTAADLNAEQKIAIDESLDIILTYGLGDRKVEGRPDIFIISAASGEISLNVCVNSDGKVTSATVDNGNTTLGSGSLRSLAIRKAKEFIFLPSLAPDQCGRMVFKIKA